MSKCICLNLEHRGNAKNVTVIDKRAIRSTRIVTRSCAQCQTKSHTCQHTFLNFVYLQLTECSKILCSRIFPFRNL